MSFTNFKTSLSGTFRPSFNESAFIFEIESTLTSRPLILFFMVDASHSMRFYIDEAKTIQRQSIVQAVAQIGVNSSGIIQDGDYINISTFSTDVKNLLEAQYIEVNDESRILLDNVVTTTLKSDGGRTNYGKAFEYLLKTFEEIKDKLPAGSTHLTGPMLVWFLTDGKPWPEEEGNTEEDIFNYSKAIGESGNELWIIGISTDANQEFLGRISFASQEGASAYQKALEDVPKEFLLEHLAVRQTLWVDLDYKSQERLIHGLVNAIEAARVNLGLIPEIELTFYTDHELALEFLSGITNLEQNGNLTKVILKRPTSLKIGQKLSIAFSLKTDEEILMHTRLFSIKTKLYRGEDIVSEKTDVYDQPLYLLLKEETKYFRGAESVRKELSQVREQLVLYSQQMNDLLVTIEALNLPDNNETLPDYQSKMFRIQRLFEQRKGLATKSEEEI